MNFSKWLKHALDAFCETANLVALVILIVPSFLTWDKVLFCIGMTVEVVYLCWASLSPRYRARRESRAQSGERGIDPLDRVLLVVSVTGFVVILFFGFGKHLLSHQWPYLTHAQDWEAGAIIWTGFFLLYYFVKFQLTGNSTWDKLVFLVLSLVGWKLLDLAWHSMESPLLHVFWVLLIGVCFLVIDLVLWMKHPSPQERNLSRTSFFWADVPMVVAFFVLLAYLWIHGDAEYKDVFVSGVVACQLLISNVLFVVMEFGLLRSPQGASVNG